MVTKRCARVIVVGGGYLLKKLFNKKVYKARASDLQFKVLSKAKLGQIAIMGLNIHSSKQIIRFLIT